MAKAYHNLAGWIRDVRAALKEGDEHAYEAAELIQELDDLIGGYPDGEPGLGDSPGLDSPSPDGDSGPDAGSGQHQVARPGVVVDPVRGRVQVPRQAALHTPDALAGADGLTDAAFRAELERRGMDPAAQRRKVGGRGRPA